MRQDPTNHGRWGRWPGLLPLLGSWALLGCPGNETPDDLDPLDRQPCSGIGGDVEFVHADGSDVYGHLRRAGDLDGDGCADRLVADSQDGTAGHDAGAVFVFYGPIEGTVALEQAHARLLGEGADGHAGDSAEGVGDTNGDGFGDVLVGAPKHPGGGGPGVAYLVRGPLSGDLDLAAADARLLGEEGNDKAGCAVAGAGDVNGDGLADLLVGAEYAGDGGMAYLVLSPVAGEFDLGQASARLRAEAASDHLGDAVAGAGDVDGDGYDDWLVGAPYNDAVAHRSGAAYLLSGPTSGELEPGQAEARLLGAADDDKAGFAVAGAGDVNGDGLDDVLIGAPNSFGVGEKSGAAFLVLGPISGTVSLADADATMTAVGAYDSAGYAVAIGGDINGDGYDDVLVGAPMANAAYLLHGPIGGTISLADADVAWHTGGGTTGTDVAIVGDTDGDGLDEVGISAPAGGPASGPGWWGGAAYLFHGE